MKTCMIQSDMSSDRASKQYPMVAVCEDCVKAEKARGEDSQIVYVEDYDPNSGDVCAFCGDEIARETE